MPRRTHIASKALRHLPIKVSVSQPTHESQNYNIAICKTLRAYYIFLGKKKNISGTMLRLETVISDWNTMKETSLMDELNNSDI
jgi:hypothetical protein